MEENERTRNENEDEQMQSLEDDISFVSGDDEPPGPENENEDDGKQISAPGFLEIVYGMFFSPANTFSAIRQFPMVGRAVVFFLFVQLLSTVNVIAIVREQFPDLLGAGFITFFPFMVLTMALIGWFLNTAVLQLLAEFMGGSGRGMTLFSALGFAYAPTLFSAPASLLLSRTNPTLLNLVTFLITFWVLGLTVLAVKTIHEFSTGKAVWVLVIPLLSILVLMLGFAVFTVMVIMGLGLTEFPGVPGL